MKLRYVVKRASPAALLGLLFGLLSLGSTAALAAGTAADTDILNRATINYEVGGAPQAAIESSPAGNTTPGAGNGTDTFFEVDNVIAFTVSEEDAAPTAVAIGATGVALGYRLSNNGNETQDFLLAALNTTPDPFGGVENFDPLAAPPVQFYVDDGDSVFNSGTDTLVTFIDELAPDTNVLIFAVYDIPNTVSAGDRASVALVAQVAQGGVAGGAPGAAITNDTNGRTSPGGAASTTADDPNAVDIVFGQDPGGAPEDVGFNFVASTPTGVQDPANNGQHVDTDTFVVVAAELAISKTSTVISDPVNGTSNPKAIPGAIIEYTIQIANGDGAPPPAQLAEALSVTDSLSAMITAGNISFVNDAYDAQPSCTAAPCGLLVTSPNITLAGNLKALSTAGDGAEQDGVGGDFGATSGDTVTVTGMQAADGQTATVQFRIEITP